jgi:hypothetical protein
MIEVVEGTDDRIAMAIALKMAGLYFKRLQKRTKNQASWMGPQFNK